MKLIIGFGQSGQAAKRFLEERGEEVIVYDDRQPIDPPWENIDQVILSPGVSLKHAVVLKSLQNNLPVIGEAQLGCRHLPGAAIGITGTNGKTTVTLLVAHVLNCCGIKAHAVGNVGTPICEALCEKREGVYVIELSSYQLETLSQKCFDVGVILNITADHLDRYDSFEQYAEAKWHLKECLKPGGVLYEPASILGETFEKKNSDAARKLCSHFGVTNEQFDKAYLTFKKPPHRLEFVNQRGGVTYYNDSKGTNIDAVIQAVAAVEGRVHLLAGGRAKGISFEPWINAFEGKVAHVYAYGEACRQIEKELSPAIGVTCFEKLKEALHASQGNARSGEVVLLSPGCASFDQYKNYMDRGEEFKELIK